MDPDVLRRACIQQLESLQRAGVTWLPAARQADSAPPAAAVAETAVAETAVAEAAVAETVVAEAAVPALPTSTATASVTDDAEPTAGDARPASLPDAARNPATMRSPATRSLVARQQALDAICGEVAACTRCPKLVANRSRTVFGVGHPRPRLCLLGEAPGADEDRLGEPFVGRAGQLLDKILAACTLSRKEVYILNVVKCRPPGNRNPEPDEADNCRPFLDRQLEVLQPEFICCLGAVAAQNLLRTTTAVGLLRGRFHDYQGIQVLVTYHPAYLLRNPAAKRDTWEDMQLLMRAMGIQLPANQ
ncbi:MAG: uracil-DNA glycosylase [Pirellulaceae bacterium]|nr:uracil-DNA glycosylase [Pirellulaceae bacterium]